MKSAEEIMEILEGFDLTASYRDAAELAGCSPNTVANWVAQRDAGTLVPGRAARRPSVIDEFLTKLEELVERSKGKIRADVAHDKITAMGFTGSERTTRRAVAEIKKAWRSGRARVHRPWIPEPGMWAQYDFGEGPRVGGASTILFCFWLAWCRFRVVVPLLDKTTPSVFAAIDAALRAVGAVPTYLLTENVPRNIFGLLRPPALCGPRHAGRRRASLVRGLRCSRTVCATRRAAGLRGADVVATVLFEVAQERDDPFEAEIGQFQGG